MIIHKIFIHHATLFLPCTDVCAFVWMNKKKIKVLNAKKKYTEKNDLYLNMFNEWEKDKKYKFKKSFKYLAYEIKQ